jgi:hypothetical protein
MTADRIASRLNHYRWPDGSVTPGSPIQNYAQACAEYEITRRRVGWVKRRVTLERASDGLGFIVGDGHNCPVLRATPGNISPHPGEIEILGK